VNTWFYQYRVPLPNGRKGKTERVTIGRAGAPPLLDFEAAKAKYIALATSVATGRNPADERRNPDVASAHSDTRTVEACFHEFLDEEYGASAERDGRAISIGRKQDIRRRLGHALGIAPAQAKPPQWKWDGAQLAELPMASITHAHIKPVLMKCAAATPVAARSLQVEMRLFWEWAIENKHAPSNPVPKKSFGKTVKRGVYLTPHQITALLKALDAEAYPHRHFVLLLLATGRRLAEVLGMRWDEIDIQKRTWTLKPSREPDGRRKSGRRHTQHISGFSMDVLEDARKHCLAGSSYVLSSTRVQGYPISDNQDALHLRLVERCGGEVAMSNDFSHKNATPTLFTWHDLRRTVATIMSTELKISTEVISKLLDHLPPGVTEEVYIAQHYGAPTIEAMEHWGEWLAARVSAKRVASPAPPLALSAPPVNGMSGTQP
jgi:integrase